MEWRTKRGLAVAFAFLMVTSLIAIPMLTGNGFSPTDDGLFGSSATDDTVDSDPPPADDDGDRASDDESTETSTEADDDSGWFSGGGGGGSGSSTASSSEPHPREGANVSYPTTEANSTVDLLQNARSHVENATDSDTGNETENAGLEATESDTELSEATTNINASIAEYRIEIFATSTDAFSYQHTAQQRLEGGEANASSDVDAARADIHRASNISARIAALDAYHLVTDHEFTHSSNEDDADDALEAAGDALERGDEASMTASTVEYEAAWEHAMDAIAAVDSDDEPDLELQRGSAVERNGTVTVPVSVQLTAVKPYDYEEAEVEIDNETETVELRPEATAGGTATGSVEVDVGTDLEHRTVNVTVPSDDGELTDSLEIDLEEDDVRWEPPAPDEHNNVSISDETSGVTVDAGGDGLYEDVLEVSDQTPETDDEYRAGPMVRIQNQTAIDSANVTIPLEEDVDPEEGNLSIYTWDPDSDGAWSAVNTTIDAENETATAEVDGFSFFSVFWIEEWEDQTSDVVTVESGDGDDNETDFEPIDVVFVVDESGSMSGDPIRFARDGAQRFTGALFENEQAGLVGFSRGSTLKQELTTDHDTLNESIERLDTGGGTNTGSGLRTGIDELEDNGWDNRSQTIILLADGRTTRGPNTVSVAEEAADKDIEISTIGLGSRIDEGELREIAATTGGDFYHVEESEDLPNAFERVAQNQTEIDLEDTNGDGIPDVVAEMNLTMPSGTGDVAGEPLNLDPIALDTSGDGLQDNETVEIEYRGFEEDGDIKVEAQVTHAKAHPAHYDTSGNGLSDYEELEIGTDPFLMDTSGDGLIDSVDPNPLEQNTPPDVRYESVGFFEDDLEVDVRPTGAADEVEETTVRKFMDETRVPVDMGQSVPYDSEWQNETFENLATDGGWETVRTDLRDERGGPNQLASKFAVEAIDDDGNAMVIEYDIDNESATVAALAASEARDEPLAAATGFGTAGIGIKTVTISAGTILATGGAVAALGVPAAGAYLSARPVDGNEINEPLEQPVPITGTAETFETPEDLDPENQFELPDELILPEGETHSIEGVETGHGTAYIDSSQSLSEAHIEHAIATASDVIEVGEFEYIIGEHLTEDEQIATVVLGEVVLWQEELQQQEDALEEELEESYEIEIEWTDPEPEPDKRYPAPDPFQQEVYENVADSLEEETDTDIRLIQRTLDEYAVETHSEPFDDDRDDDSRCTLNERDIDMSVQSTETGTFIAAPSGYKSFNGTYEETANSVETELRCVDDRDAVVDTYADDPTDITDGSLGENISVEIVEERGYDVIWPADGFEPGDASEQGPDVIAYDEDEWLIIEAKTTTSTEAVGKSLLSTDAYDGDAQLHDGWITNGIEQQLLADDKIDSETAEEIISALGTGNVTKEVVFVRDVPGSSDRTLTTPASDETDISREPVAGVDEVTIIELQGTT